MVAPSPLPSPLALRIAEADRLAQFVESLLVSFRDLCQEAEQYAFALRTLLDLLKAEVPTTPTRFMVVVQRVEHK